MSENTWQLPQKGPGRSYMQAQDIAIRFPDAAPLVANIVENLKGFIHLESAVRFVLDGPAVTAATTTISVPFEGSDEVVYENLAQIIYQQLWGYYLSANPRGTHHGLTNLVFEGSETSLIRREAEKFLQLIGTRSDMAARVMQNYHMASDVEPLNRDVYLKHLIKDSLDVEVGVRLYTHGDGVNRANVFLPTSGGGEAIDRIYYNLEHIVHQNLVSYDENHDHYLPVAEELVLREIEGVMGRARDKANTRKKLINGLKFHTVLMEDPSLAHHASLADMYYDKINRIDLLEEAAQRSRDLFATALVRSTELTVDAGVDVNNLKMDEQVYIERPQTSEEPVPARAKSQQQQPAAAVKSDGLMEL